ncbi:MAG: XRE family transcriptional regulator [Candidatus Acidiferrales bacterium]
MAKNFKELRAKMSPESRARAEAKANQMTREMALDELREARLLTQEQLAEQLNVRQPAVARMERRADMYVSTLRGVIKAMGGELDIRAIFPDGTVRINQFKQLRKASVKIG